MYICISACICMYKIYRYMCACVCYMYALMCVWMFYVWTCVFEYVYVCVYVFVCLYVFICVYVPKLMWTFLIIFLSLVLWLPRVASHWSRQIYACDKTEILHLNTSVLTSGHAGMIFIYSPKFCHVVKGIYFKGSYGVFRVF